MIMVIFGSSSKNGLSFLFLLFLFVCFSELIIYKSKCGFTEHPFLFFTFERHGAILLVHFSESAFVGDASCIRIDSNLAMNMLILFILLLICRCGSGCCCC